MYFTKCNHKNHMLKTLESSTVIGRFKRYCPDSATSISSSVAILKLLLSITCHNGFDSTLICVIFLVLILQQDKTSQKRVHACITEHPYSTVPERSKLENSVQIYQFLEEISFAAPTSEPHSQGQRGNKNAATEDAFNSSTTVSKKHLQQNNYHKIKKRDQKHLITIKSSNCRWYQARIVYSILLQSFRNSARSEGSATEH